MNLIADLFRYKRNKDKFFAVMQLVLIYGLMFNPWTVFPFTFIIIIGAILILTYWKYRSFSEVGLKTDLGILKVISYALILFIIVEPIFDFVIQPLINTWYSFGLVRLLVKSFCFEDLCLCI